MIRTAFSRGAALAALVLLAACHDAQCTDLAVPVTAVPGPQMTSPVPGATGLPTSGFTVQIAFGNVSYGERLRLVDQNGRQLLGGTFAPIVPPPAGTGFIQANLEAAVPQLAPATTYTVFVDGSSPRYTITCPPGTGGGPFSYQLGTFTTG